MVPGRTWEHGAHPLPGGEWRFQVWAPSAKKVDLHVLSRRERVEAMKPPPNGYFRPLVDGLEPGSCYRFFLDGSKERPDPASRCQPEGVHGPSQVLAPLTPHNIAGARRQRSMSLLPRGLGDFSEDLLSPEAG